MSFFPSAKHLVSWAGCCPRNDHSNKEVKSTRISRAGSYLKPLLVLIANAIIKSNKYPECKERYRRIKSRRGHKKPSSPCAGCSWPLSGMSCLSLSPIPQRNIPKTNKRSTPWLLQKRRDWNYCESVTTFSQIRFRPHWAKWFLFCRRNCGCGWCALLWAISTWMLFQTFALFLHRSLIFHWIHYIIGQTDTQERYSKQSCVLSYLDAVSCIRFQQWTLNSPPLLPTKSGSPRPPGLPLSIGFAGIHQGFLVHHQPKSPLFSYFSNSWGLTIWDLGVLSHIRKRPIVAGLLSNLKGISAQFC